MSAGAAAVRPRDRRRLRHRVPRRRWLAPPDVGDAPVLAVDIPSGVDGAHRRGAGRGARRRPHGDVRRAEAGPAARAGRTLAGRSWSPTSGSTPSRRHRPPRRGRRRRRWWRPRAGDAHKWRPAVRVIAGSRGHDRCRRTWRRRRRSAPVPAWCACRSPGVDDVRRRPPRSVRATAAGDRTGRRRCSTPLDRFQALVIGPGLGREPTPRVPPSATCAAAADVPLVVDGDGLIALALESDGAAASARRSGADGAHAARRRVRALTGAPPGADRSRRPARLAADTGAVVLLKGPTTVVADPDGEVLRGRRRRRAPGHRRHRRRARGIIGALLAAGLPPFDAAAAGAWIHAGAPASRRPGDGFVAGDLVDALPDVLAGLGRRRVTGTRAWAWAEVDLDAIAAQRRAAARRSSRPAGVWAVVKADGYGHGAVPVGPGRRSTPAPPGCAWRSPRRASSCAHAGIDGADPAAQRAAARRARRRSSPRPDADRVHVDGDRRARPRVGRRRRRVVACTSRSTPGCTASAPRPARSPSSWPRVDAGRRRCTSPGCSPTSPSPTSPTTRTPTASSTRFDARARARSPRATVRRACTPPTRPARSPIRRAAT